MLNKTRLQKAYDAFCEYDFGEDVLVIDSDGWEDTETNDWIKVVYAEFIPDATGSEKISLHVNFEKDSDTIIDVYAYLVSNGGEIGYWDKPK